MLKKFTQCETLKGFSSFVCLIFSLFFKNIKLESLTPKSSVYFVGDYYLYKRFDDDFFYEKEKSIYENLVKRLNKKYQNNSYQNDDYQKECEEKNSIVKDYLNFNNLYLKILNFLVGDKCLFFKRDPKYICLSDFLFDFHLNVDSYENLIKKIKIIFKNMTNNLKELHESDIVHSDVKLDNYLINRETFETKLIDHDLSTDISKNEKIKNLSGTEGFYDPNLENFFDDPEKIDNETLIKSDIYSLGVCFHYFISHKTLFSKNKEMNKNEPFYFINDENLIYLVKNLTSPKIEDRMGIKEIEEYLSLIS